MGSSTTTRNFGMRRFTNLVRDGRMRAPAGSSLMLGTLVEQDPSSPDEIREADGTAGAAIGGTGNVATGKCGILWYEHDAQTYNGPEWGAAAGQLPQDLNTAPGGRMVQVLSGKGAKVWFRNTALDTTEPGLNFPAERPAVTMVNGVGTTLSVGDLLGWDAANNYWDATVDLTEAFLVVTSIDTTLGKVEAELLH